MQREMMQAAVATIYDEVLSKWRGDLFLPTVAAPCIRHNRNACEWYRRRGRRLPRAIWQGVVPARGARSPVTFLSSACAKGPTT